MNKLLFPAIAGAWALLPGVALAASANFQASATLQPALSVNCSEDLRFGTISVEPDNSEGTITVEAVSGAGATSSNTDIYPAESDSGPAACTITNSTGVETTVQLSSSSTSASGTTLSDVMLTSGEGALSAAIGLSKAIGIGNETIYVGGTLVIPAGHLDWGTYSETFTLTIIVAE